MCSSKSKTLTREAKQPSQEIGAWLWSDPMWQWLVTHSVSPGRQGGMPAGGTGLLALEGARCSFMARLSSFQR